MYCTNPRCISDNYCYCSDQLPQASAGGIGIIFLIIFGFIASFLYPSVKILRADQEYDDFHNPKFAGSLWLFLSPLFGFLSNMLYQIIFAAGACSLGALQLKVTNYVYITGMFVIYALAIGLALLAFLFKNFSIIKLFLQDSTSRSGNKSAVLIGSIVMVLLVAAASFAAVFSSLYGYSNYQADKKAKFEYLNGSYSQSYRGKKATEIVMMVEVINDETIKISQTDKNKVVKNAECIYKNIPHDGANFTTTNDCSITTEDGITDGVFFPASKPGLMKLSSKNLIYEFDKIK